MNTTRIISIVLAFVAVTLIAYLFIQKESLQKERANLKTNLTQLEQLNASTTQELTDVLVLLNSVQKNYKNSQGYISGELIKINNVDVKLKELTDIVDVLEKLSKTDTELLKKYSRVYFLNENYIPLALSQVPLAYSYNQKELRIHSGVLPFLQSMIVSASNAGINLRIVSAYRSFNEQAGLKSAYNVIYGDGANKFSADQGYSEHQLGSTLDFTTAELGAAFTSFDDTLGYVWLLENAYKFGFILSYPEKNKYYTYEPWHWRFVGVSLAGDLQKLKKPFYDMSQREIDGYLISIFN